MKEILKDCIVVVRNQKEEVIHGIDQVVLALGAKPVEHLSAVIKNKIRKFILLAMQNDHDGHSSPLMREEK